MMRSGFVGNASFCACAVGDANTALTAMNKCMILNTFIFLSERSILRDV
jgi:hypothetical protein